MWLWHGKLCLHVTVSSIFGDGMASCVCTWQCHPHLMMARQAVSAVDSVIHISLWNGKLCLHLTVSSTFDNGTASCVFTWQCHPHVMMERQAVSTLDSVIHIWWWQGKLCLHLTVSSTFWWWHGNCVCTWQCHPNLMMEWEAVSTLDSVIHIWWCHGKLCLHVPVSSTFDLPSCHQYNYRTHSTTHWVVLCMTTSTSLTTELASKLWYWDLLISGAPWCTRMSSVSNWNTFLNKCFSEQ